MAGESGADNMAVLGEQAPKQHNPQRRPNLGRVASEIGGAILIGSLALGGAAKVAGIGPFHSPDSAPPPASTQKQDGGMPSANLPITTETPTATATKTPEVIKAFDGSIFSPDIRAKYVGEIFEDPRFPGRTFIGFNLPKDTKIFSDEDGITTFSKVNTFGIVNAILSTSSSPDKSTTSIWGDVKFTKASDGGAMYTGTPGTGTGNTEAGDETGVVQDTGIKINGKYNVVVNFGTRDAQGNFGDDVKAIQAEFPNAKPATTK